MKIIYFAVKDMQGSNACKGNSCEKHKTLLNYQLCCWKTSFFFSHIYCFIISKNTRARKLWDPFEAKAAVLKHIKAACFANHVKLCKMCVSYLKKVCAKTSVHVLLHTHAVLTIKLAQTHQREINKYLPFSFRLTFFFLLHIIHV